MRGSGLATRRVALVALLGAAVVGCAGSKPIQFDTGASAPTTSSITPLPTGTATGATTNGPTTARPGTATTGVPAPVTATWTPAAANLTGLPSECGNLSLVSARPDRDMVIASVSLRGLWSSENGATTWSALGTGPGSAKITNRGSSIVYDPDHPDTFWESGIYNGGAVYRTDDNGATFRQLGLIGHADAVSVDLSDPARRTLLTNRHETSNLYRSTDGGTSWSDISASLPSGIGFTTGPYVVNAQTHLLGTNNGPKAGVYRTTDGGSTWTNVYDGAAVGRPLVTHSDSALYWVLSTGGIIRSTDGGATWTKTTRDGTLSKSATNLVELPNGNLAAVGNQVVIVSADHGATWRAVGPGMPYVPSGFTYSPFRNAFYVWHFDCDFSTNNPIPANAILSLSYDYKTQ